MFSPETTKTKKIFVKVTMKTNNREKKYCKTCSMETESQVRKFKICLYLGWASLKQARTVNQRR